MKLVEMAKHIGHGDTIRRIVGYANDPNYVVKIRDQMHGHLEIIHSAFYPDEDEMGAWFAPEDDMEPFVSVMFHPDDDADIWNPEEFAEAAQVYELKRIK